MANGDCGISRVILLVEDNPGDIRLIREALRDSVLPVTLEVMRDGAEALAYLRRQPPYDNAPRPDLILLDLNLPKKDGREVLACVKGDPTLRRIPVVVLTTSEAPQDIMKSYDLHANCYVTKPMDLQQYITAVQAIENFWCTRVQLPLS